VAIRPIVDRGQADRQTVILLAFQEITTSILLPKMGFYFMFYPYMPGILKRTWCGAVSTTWRAIQHLYCLHTTILPIRHMFRHKL